MYRAKKHSEHYEQVKLFNWLSALEYRYPFLKYIFAIPNESYGGSQQAIRRGRYFKAEGRKRGVPDIFVPIPNNEFAGMFIEMKFGKNRVSKEQNEYLKFLKEAGYYTIVCYSFEEAKDAIINYLGLEVDI